MREPNAKFTGPGAKADATCKRVAGLLTPRPALVLDSLARKLMTTFGIRICRYRLFVVGIV